MSHLPNFTPFLHNTWFLHVNKMRKPWADPICFNYRKWISFIAFATRNNKQKHSDIKIQFERERENLCRWLIVCYYGFLFKLFIANLFSWLTGGGKLIWLCEKLFSCSIAICCSVWQRRSHNSDAKMLLTTFRGEYQMLWLREQPFSARIIMQ